MLNVPEDQIVHIEDQAHDILGRLQGDDPVPVCFFLFTPDETEEAYPEVVRDVGSVGSA
jgi:hypothetical protein